MARGIKNAQTHDQIDELLKVFTSKADETMNKCLTNLDNTVDFMKGGIPTEYLQDIETPEDIAQAIFKGMASQNGLDPDAFSDENFLTKVDEMSPTRIHLSDEEVMQVIQPEFVSALQDSIDNGGGIDGMYDTLSDIIDTTSGYGDDTTSFNPYNDGNDIDFTS